MGVSHLLGEGTISNAADGTEQKKPEQGVAHARCLPEEAHECNRGILSRTRCYRGGTSSGFAGARFGTGALNCDSSRWAMSTISSVGRALGGRLRRVILRDHTCFVLTHQVAEQRIPILMSELVIETELGVGDLHRQFGTYHLLEGGGAGRKIIQFQVIGGVTDRIHEQRVSLFHCIGRRKHNQAELMGLLGVDAAGTGHVLQERCSNLVPSLWSRCCEDPFPGDRLRV